MTLSGLGDAHAFCNIGSLFDCTAIEVSRFAEFLPGIPLSAVAIAGYLMIFILSLVQLKRKHRNTMLLFTGIAFAFSMIYFVIMLTLGKLCILCLGIDLLNAFMLIVAFKLPKQEHKEKFFGMKPLTNAIIGIVVVVSVFYGIKPLDPLADANKTEITEFVDRVLESPSVSIDIPQDAFVVGNPNAKITLVEFGDFQCPPCKMAAAGIQPLFKRYGDQLKFVFLNFPWAMECNSSLKQTMHTYACEAASVAVCAGKQGKFLDAYETLFEKQEEFIGGQISTLLQSNVNTIDAGKLKECMALPSTELQIKSNADFGVRLQVASTPTFFINGHRLDTGLPTSVWIELIERFLKK